MTVEEEREKRGARLAELLETDFEARYYDVVLRGSRPGVDEVVAPLWIVAGYIDKELIQDILLEELTPGVVTKEELLAEVARCRLTLQDAIEQTPNVLLQPVGMDQFEFDKFVLGLSAPELEDGLLPYAFLTYVRRSSGELVLQFWCPKSGPCSYVFTIFKRLLAYQ
jgi:hypothetical protein